MACPVPPAGRPRLRGARRASAAPPRPRRALTVQRRVSSRSSIMVATQKIHVGMIHARKAVTVIAGDDQFTIVIDGETATVVPAPPPGKFTATRSLFHPPISGV